MDLSDLNSEVREKYKPLSAWAYWGYSILFFIPIIGQIFLIVFCFAGQNVNRKNYARGCAIGLIILLVIILLCGSYISLFFQNFSNLLDGFNDLNDLNDNSHNSFFNSDVNNNRDDNNKDNNSYEDIDLDQLQDMIDHMYDE